MVHRLHDIRLLENLVKSEKEYSAALVHLFGLSHTSIASLSAYGAASSPTTSQAILSVAAALAGADEAFRSYTASIDDWTEKLKEIKRLESEIENMARDREILVTRLLKASKQKPTRETILGPPSPNNLSRENVLSASKLALAQSELQACEVQLNVKQRELDQVTRSAIHDGLSKRCKAMVDCGYVWSERGREGLQALERLGNQAQPTNGHAFPYGGPAPPFRSLSPASGIDSTTSLAPSQSASQIAANLSPIQSEDTHHVPTESIDHAFHSSGSPTDVVNLNSPLPHLPITLATQIARDHPPTISPTPVRAQSRDSAAYRLAIPPAHSIEDHVYPSGTAENNIMDDSSSDDQHGPLVVRENPALISQPQERMNGAVNGTSSDKPSAPTTTVPPIQTRSAFGLKRTQQPSGTSQLSEGKQHAAESPQRSPTKSFFGRLFGSSSNRSKGSDVKTSDTSQRHRKESSNGSGPFGMGGRTNKRHPTAPIPNGGGNWQTRTDKNLAKGAAGDSSSDEERRMVKPATVPRSGGIASTSDRTTGGGKSTLKRGGSLKKSGTAPDLTAGLSHSAPRPRERKAATSNSDGEDHGGDVSRRLSRLSRHSSDGAIHSKAVSQEKVERSPSRAHSDAEGHHRRVLIKRSKESLKSKEKQLPQEPPIEPPRAIPHPDANQKDEAVAAGVKRGGSTGRKIRKKSLNRGGPKSSKAFVDGLGSSGGALVIGGPNVPPKDNPNDTRPLSPVLSTGQLSRSNTIKSNTSEPGLFNGKGRLQGGAAARRSSLQYEYKPDIGTGRADHTLSSLGHGRSLSQGGDALRSSSQPVNGQRNQQSLMRIVETVSNNSPYSTSRLESVKAPGNGSSLELPRAPPSVIKLNAKTYSTDPPPPPKPSKPQPLPIRSSSPQTWSSRPFSEEPVNRLVLPSETTNHGYGSKDTRLPAVPTIIPPLATSNIRTSMDSHASSNSQSATRAPMHSALMPPPLKSALRTRSPSPVPVAGPSNHPHALQVAASPKPPSPKTAQLPPPHIANGRHTNDDDGASISSYETGHENVYDSKESSLTDVPGSSIPPPILQNPLLNSNQTDEREKKGTDLSTSLSSESTSQPVRRKSVRMALPPSANSTPAVTPAALENEKEWIHAGQSSEASRGGNTSTGQSRIDTSNWPQRPNAGAKDAWDDSSDDDDVAYIQARRALAKADKAFATAGDLEKKPRRH